MAPSSGSLQVCAEASCNLEALKSAPQDINLDKQVTCPNSNSRLGAGNYQSIAKDIADTHLIRAAALRDCLKLAAPVNTLPTTTLTTGTLFHHEHGGGSPGDRQANIGWQFRRSDKPAKVDATLGAGMKGWSMSAYMPDIKAEIVGTLNQEWIKKHAAPILPDHTALRFAGNKNLHPGTATLTLGEFYNHYLTPGSMQFFLKDVPSNWKSYLKSKTPFLCLDIYINMDQWRETHELKENRSFLLRNSVIGQKRCGSSLPEESSRISKQRHFAHAGLGLPRNPVASQFRLSSRETIKSMQKITTIKFQKIFCQIDTITGQQSFIENAGPFNGHIYDKPFAKGSMKGAYELLMTDLEGGDTRYVAKHFFRLEEKDSDDTIDSADSLDVMMHNIQIQAKLGRLALGKWFWSEFIKVCHKGSVTIDINIVFADGFIIQEIGPPSPASSIDGTDIPFSELGLMWLVERWHPTTVERYTGTLSHDSNGKDLRTSTIHAFSHFAYGHSNQELVFADLQGTPSQVQGMDGITLFDPMTHTLNGDSGIGDWGIGGMETYFWDHICNFICLQLGFDKKFMLELRGTPDEGHRSEDGDDDEGDNANDSGHVVD